MAVARYARQHEYIPKGAWSLLQTALHVPSDGERTAESAWRSAPIESELAAHANAAALQHSETRCRLHKHHIRTCPVLVVPVERQQLHQACRDHVKLFPRQEARGDGDSSSVTLIIAYGQGSDLRTHVLMRPRFSLCRQVHPVPFN